MPNRFRHPPRRAGGPVVVGAPREPQPRTQFDFPSKYCPYCGRGNLWPLTSLVNEGIRYACGRTDDLVRIGDGCGAVFLVRRLQA